MPYLVTISWHFHKMIPKISSDFCHIGSFLWIRYVLGPSLPVHTFLVHSQTASFKDFGSRLPVPVPARRRLDPVYHFRVGHFGKFEFIFGSSSLRAGEQYSAARRIAISAQVSSEGTLPIIFIIKYIHQ